MASEPVSPVVEKLLQVLTLEEKVSLVAGQNMWQTAEIERLGIQPLQTTDGPAGARGTKWNYGSLTTFIPSAISLAATFDPSIVEKVGNVLGEETRRKGCHVLLAPTMNFSRSPLGGRNFESYGEDPFLIGTISNAMIRGIQNQGVGACMKHFILNDTETRRFNVDQTIDERTLREVYMKPFTMVLEAAPWTAMVSYPKVNGIHADMSSYVLQKLLREELQFDRLVMSDWGGCNSTAESLIAGTDLEMPGPPIRRGELLLSAIRDGQVDETKHLDTSVRRALQLLERAALLPSLERLNGELEPPEQEKRAPEQPSDDKAFHKTVREAAESGLVLLKNENLLPLHPSTLSKVAILGPNARIPTAGGSGSAAVNPFYITTPEECLTEALHEAHPGIQVSYDQGIPFTLRPPLFDDALLVPECSKQGVQVEFFAGHEFQGPVVATTFWVNSLLYMMSDGDVPLSLKGKPYCYRVTGVVTPKVSGQYTLSIANTGKAKLFIDGRLLIDNTVWTTTTGGFLGCSSEDKAVSLRLEVGCTYSLQVDNVVTLPLVESFDNTLFPAVSGLRFGLRFNEDEDVMLDRAVQSARESDVAILIVGHNKDSEGEGGDRADMKLPGRTNELVSSVCAANPYTIVVVQAGSAITMPWADKAGAIVLGWYQGQENGHALANALLGHCNFSGKTPITFPKKLADHGSSKWFPGEAARDRTVFGEGVLMGYRSFDEHKIEPLWPFGFGLSYTTFELSNIHIKGVLSASSRSDVTVQTTVSNMGRFGGHEVIQVYASPSDSIRKNGLQSFPKTLVGFTKVWVPTGESRDVSIIVRNEDFRWYDVKAGFWRIDTGTYTFFVGTSARDIVCELKLNIV
jgi:beta-glucosidase-like glycosyl hydrolase